MPWSYANIDWNGTGAMVQAVGSVAAIVAAIWIDQGTARRQRAERLAQVQADTHARTSAMTWCRDITKSAEVWVRGVNLTNTTRGNLMPVHWRGFESAGQALRLHLRGTSTLPPEMATALILYSRTMRQLVLELRGATPFSNENGRQNVLRLLGDASKELEEINLELDEGLM